MLRWLWLAIAFPALLCAQLYAQQPSRGPRPWWDSNIARDLNLTDAQTKQIRATVQEFRGRMFDLRTAASKAESEVQAAFDEDPVDQRKATAAIDQLASTRADLTKALSEMDLKLRTILTAEQWQELKRRQRSWPGRGGRRGGAPSATGTSTGPALKQ